MNMTRWSPRIALALVALAAGPALADPVGLTRDMMSVTVDTAGGPVEIMREQDNAARLDGDWTLTSRPCPNFCIQPMIPAEGVTPVGELEVLAALQDPDTLVIDGRIPSEFEAGTIPGAISMPYNEAADRLGELGCEVDFDGWICEGDLPQVVLFCNGPWCGQSPTAARNMIEAGFPAENISYYRGGMQNWHMLGLTVVPGGAGG
jgi:rhodanese-related sulfurtransferase